MTKPSQDRSLHFVVRHHSYQQNKHYGAYMNHVLEELNAHPPIDAKGMLEDAANLMSGKLMWGASIPMVSQEANHEAMQDKVAGEKLAPQFRELEFGPANEEAFGFLQHKETEGRRPLSTPVSGRLGGYRGYYDAYKRNIGKETNTDSTITFSYPSPSGQKMPLMKVLIGNDTIFEEIDKMAATNHAPEASVMNFKAVH